MESSSKMGYSYKLPNSIKKESIESKCYLAGIENFRILEIEMYIVAY